MKSLKGDRGDNRLLPSCWFSKLVIEGENECLPLLYYHHWDALEQCSKPWLQLRAFLQKMAEFTAKLFRMNKSYARKQNQEVVSLTSSPFGMWHSPSDGGGREKFGGHSRTHWRDYNNKGLMQICRNRSVSEFHRNVQRMRLWIKMPKWKMTMETIRQIMTGVILCLCVCFLICLLFKKNPKHVQAVNSWLQK